MKALNIAMRDGNVVQHLADMIIAAGNQQPLIKIMLRNDLRTVWLLFEFPPRIPPLTFRVLVDLVNEITTKIEKNFIPMGLSTD